MDILDLTLKDYKLYSPATGELIYDARKKYLNEEAKSLAACWHYDSDDRGDYYREGFDPASEHFVDVFSGTTIKHDRLLSAWESYLIEIPIGVKDPKEMESIDLENFILSFQKDPSLICFRITRPEKPNDRMYFVIEMKEE